MKAIVLWSVLPYVTAVLFFVIPFLRMRYRPFGWTTRASSLFGNRSLGAASLPLHWGLLLLLTGHLIGLFGALSGSDAALTFFYWFALVGGIMTLLGSIIALTRRVVIPEVRAMSQAEDYIIHLLLIPIIGLALYQVLVHRLFGMAYPVSGWVGSLWTLNPQPELMLSASVITKWHVFLAMTFFGYFPFTKLVHFWTYPVNYFVRPRQAMRTMRRRAKGWWELGLRTDKSWLTYGLTLVAAIFLTAGALLGHAQSPPGDPTVQMGALSTIDLTGQRLSGYPLFVHQCAGCHGADGAGDGHGARSRTFAQPPRNMVEGNYRFISTTNSTASDEDLERTIRNGLVPAGMPAFGYLSDAQIRSLVQTLGKLRASPAPNPVPIDISPPPQKSDLQRGAQVFNQYCASCHGDTGRGDGLAATALPIRPRNLSRPDGYKAGADPYSIYRRVAAGVPPYMPPQHASLSSGDIWDVVAYVRTLQEQTGDPISQP